MVKAIGGDGIEREFATYTGVTTHPWVPAGTMFGKHWYIVNLDTKRSVKIGPVNRRGTNYFDRACAEATRRNQEIANKSSE